MATKNQMLDDLGATNQATTRLANQSIPSNYLVTARRHLHAPVEMTMGMPTVKNSPKGFAKLSTIWPRPLFSLPLSVMVATGTYTRVSLLERYQRRMIIVSLFAQGSKI
jgi:hypothetical protein